MRQFALISLFALITLSSIAAEAYEVPTDPAAREQRIKTLEKGMADIESYWWFDHFNELVHEVKCAEEFRIVKQTFETAEQLDKQHANNPTEQYQKDMRNTKEQNKFAREDFEICFNAAIRNNQAREVREHNITDLTSFKAAQARFKRRFDGKDTDALHSKYSEEHQLLTDADNDGSILGKVGAVYKKVELLRAGKWIPVKEGMTVYLLDEIRTGPQGRAKVELSDYYPSQGRGPTVANIGANSQLKFTEFDLSFVEHTGTKPQRVGKADLTYGVVRFFTKNWGEKSRFVVRTGTSLCGIRGTDVMISYDPDKDKTDYLLSHGHVEIQTPNKTVSLKGSKKLEIASGKVGSALPLGESEWMNAVINTSAAGDIAIAKNVKTNEAAAIIESFEEAMTAFKYKRAEELLKYTTDVYDKTIPEKVKDPAKLQAMTRIPVKWKKPCLGSCISKTECRVYVGMWLDTTEDLDGPASAYVHVMKKKEGIWKLADLENVPDGAKLEEYAQKMRECGIYQ